MNCDDFSKVEPLTLLFGHPHRLDVMASYTLHSYKALSNQKNKIKYQIHQEVFARFESL